MVASATHRKRQGEHLGKHLGRFAAQVPPGAKAGRAAPRGIWRSGMTVTKRQTMLLASAAAAVAAFAAVQVSQPARAEAGASVGQRVDDFFLADQNLLGRQLYRHADDKAVVLYAYAPGDAQVKADAKAL